MKILTVLLTACRTFYSSSKMTLCLTHSDLTGRDIAVSDARLRFLSTLSPPSQVQAVVWASTHSGQPAW